MTTQPPEHIPGLPVALSSLRKGESAVVAGVRDDHLDVGDEVRSTLAQRLLELGFIPGERLEVIGAIWPYLVALAGFVVLLTLLGALTMRREVA